MDDYLTKPFSPQELLARAQNLLERYQTRKEWLNIEGEKVAFEKEEKAEAENSMTYCNSDLEWLKKVEKHIVKELENSKFHITELADEFSLSRRQFQRKINKLTGLSPKNYQQEIAMQKARELLEAGNLANVTAAGYSIGMSNSSRFSKLYYERFGKKPSEYFKPEIMDE